MPVSGLKLTNLTRISAIVFDIKIWPISRNFLQTIFTVTKPCLNVSPLLLRPFEVVAGATIGLSKTEVLKAELESFV